MSNAYRKQRRIQNCLEKIKQKPPILQNYVHTEKTITFLCLDTACTVNRKFFYVFTAEGVNSTDMPQNMVQRRDFVIRLLNFQV